MRTNSKARNTATTHGGAPATAINTMQALRRSVLSCLLGENEFYEDGKDIKARIEELAAQVKPEELAALAYEARTDYNLRHVPLLLAYVLTTTGQGRLVRDTIARVIQRADDITEFVAIYWSHAKPGKARRPLSWQTKLGLADAFAKFDEYQLAKYDRDTVVKLRDVMRMVHPKPGDTDRAALFKRVLDRTLTTPDTWEVALSGGADKKETFTRLLEEGKLGYLALIRNLRNMDKAGVPTELVDSAIRARKGAHRVLPFRYFAAAREAPHHERALDDALIAGFKQLPKLQGKTVVVLDVSGSMGAAMSGRSTMTRLDAGAALAAVIVGQCENPVVYATAGNDSLRQHKTAQLPARQGMALRDAFTGSMPKLGYGGIFLTPMLTHVLDEVKEADRVVVITDEQDCAAADKNSPRLAKPFGTHNYLINVASHKNGIGYGGKWVHVDGVSEATVRYIQEYEASLVSGSTGPQAV